MSELSHLPVVFFALLGLAILIYAILDGYDLGVGILLPMDDEKQRDTMIASIGPFWDANETWLVLAVGLLLVAFPLAQGQIFQTLYLPTTFMLIGLIFRGVAFDFRAKSTVEKKLRWDWGFKLGSLCAALAQGYMLGIYALGLNTGPTGQLFGSLSALGVVSAYCLIGACWLLMKTEGALQQRALHWVKPAKWFSAIGIVAVCLVNIALHDKARALWLATDARLFLWLIPLGCLGLFLVLSKRLKNYQTAGFNRSWQPFVLCVAVFALAFIGLGVTYWPDIIPGQMTLWQAAADDSALRFLLVGTLITLPAIILYTAFVYRVFWGKAIPLRYY